MLENGEVQDADLEKKRVEQVSMIGVCVCVCFYWRASVASETLTGVKMKKSGMFIYLYICLDVCMSFCTLTLAFLC